jgi:hypothetical protein
MFARASLCFLLFVAALSGQVRLTDPPYYTDAKERFSNYLFRTYTDPARFCWLLVDSAKDTWSKDPYQWDRSAQSYSYRVASAWGRRIVRNTAQYGLETMLREDSRYRPSNERGFGKRALFAIRYSLLAYKPDGSTEPAYGRIGAGLIGAAASSTWHPQSVSPAAMFSGAGQAVLDRAGNNLLTEFTPDLKNFGRRAWKQIRK